MKTGFDERLRKFVLSELAALLAEKARVMAEAIAEEERVMAEIEDGIDEIEQFEIQQSYGGWA